MKNAAIATTINMPTTAIVDIPLFLANFFSPFFTPYSV
jgi:hypothetical protein